ncbi:hypothetical protein BGW80DRAFT_867783 [Lactifluus volemus]|nr:hypothetical protein BGW80DRAFT_867783 [Lactifluus volemus]
MVNWHDPVILEEDYVAVIKLDHVVAGIYIWETVVTAGFELDILRGKLPYRRTIWLYLGTRYSGLFVFIMVVIRMDGPAKLSCQASIAIDALANASWVFASILFALRVIAIWDRNVFVTSLVIGTWLAGLALNIYSLTGLRGPYNSTLETCLSFDNRKYLINTAGLVAIDVILIATMLIGLLRWCRGSSTGLWRLLYQQCIIWLVLAAIAEIPVITLLILNFNKAMNEAFTGVAVAIMFVPGPTFPAFNF